MKFVGMIVAVIIASGSYFEYSNSTPVLAAKIVTVEAKREVPPMLAKIEKCESKTGMYKDGQVVINTTQDIGLAQINLPTWAKKATKMGLDLSKPEDNQKFAVYLFDNYGVAPWKSSQGCWGNK